MDLHAKTAVCYAVFAGEGEPRDKHREFLEDFNRRHRTQGSGPEDMAAIAGDLRGHEAHVLIENSTKTYETYWVLTNLGVHVVVAQAQDLYRITKSVKKTDDNDSVELAGYMRRYLRGEREFAECTMPPKEWMMRREVCRVIFRETSHLADLKRRCRAHMLLHGIKLSKDYSDVFSRSAIREMTDTRDPCLLMMLSEARGIKARNLEEVRLIEHLLDGDRTFELIRSIPGFGTVTAAYLASMIMDVGRFPTRDSFTAYFGVVPRMRESAESNPNCGTTHRGDDDMRRLLMQATLVHVNFAESSVVTEMWRRLKSRGKAHREVQVACARKLLTVVWSVLRSGRPYTCDPESLRGSDELAERLAEDDEA